jgi:hypothetical protein
MIDAEVERLRRLRGSALRLRAVARALGSKRSIKDEEGLFIQGRCAAWRIARTVTGRLRAHPNSRYQQDAGVGTLLKNSLTAVAASLTATNRQRAMTEFAAHLKAVLRELDNARALAWAVELSDAFGRSQRELRDLAAVVECQPQHRGAAVGARGALREARPVTAGSPFLTI